MCVPTTLTKPSNNHLKVTKRNQTSYITPVVVEMATALSSVQISTTVLIPKASVNKENLPKAQLVSFPLKQSCTGSRIMRFRAAATPPDLSSKVSESIGKAQETCEDDPKSGECVAAWDEVEELSAAASHARDKQKESDPLEEYCKDNPETDECRTYED